MANNTSKKARAGKQIIASNRKARHNYSILEEYEAGIALLGTHHAAALIAAGKLKRVLPKFVSRRSDICIYYAARKHLPPRVAAFVEFVVEEVRHSEFVHQSRELVLQRSAFDKSTC